MFNSNVAPKTRKTERPVKTWECTACGTENGPWLKQCLECGKRPK